MKRLRCWAFGHKPEKSGPWTFRRVQRVDGRRLLGVALRDISRVIQEGPYDLTWQRDTARALEEAVWFNEEGCYVRCACGKDYGFVAVYTKVPEEPIGRLVRPICFLIGHDFEASMRPDVMIFESRCARCHFLAASVTERERCRRG